MRQHSLLATDKVDVRKFEALRRVQRDERDAAHLLLLFFFALVAEQHRVEPLTETLALAVVVGLKIVEQVFDVLFPLQPFLRRLAGALKVGEVAAVGQ